MRNYPHDSFEARFFAIFNHYGTDGKSIGDILAFVTDFAVAGLIESHGPEKGLALLSQRVNGAALALREAA